MNFGSPGNVRIVVGGLRESGIEAGVTALDSSFGGVGGCPFAPRCFRAEARCREERPALETRVTRLRERYAELSASYQDGKSANAIPLR